jgi:hypothetical protein
MKPEKRTIPSREHEQMYHATACCQAASLSLTARRLHGLKNACSVEGKKTGGFASHRKMLLSCFEFMEPLRLHKGRRIIGLVGLEHGEKNACPNIRQSPNGDAMTFPFCTFALIVGQGPLFLQRALPGKLMQGIAQWFDTRHPPMGLGVVPALRTKRARCHPELASWQLSHSETDRLRFQRAGEEQVACRLRARS